jgi:DNA-binding response OmpR family regulator
VDAWYSDPDHQSDSAFMALRRLMQESTRRARTPQLLIVEDQDLLSELIAEELSNSFEVLRAATVEEGVELLLAAAVDAVLLDCVLPGGTMWQIVLEADRQNVPVVLMTGDAEQMKDIAGGPRPYILKPFALHDLRAVLESVMRQREGSR